MSTISDGVITFTFKTMRGRLREKRMVLADITRPGVNGIEFRRRGNRGAPYVMGTVADVQGAANADTRARNYEYLIGSIVTLVDGFGNSHANQALLDVEPHIVVASLMVGGDAGSNHLVMALWTLQDTSGG